MRSVILLAVAALVLACRGGPDDPGWVVYSGMLEPVAWHAFDPHPLLRAGQPPPAPAPGTVPTGQPTFLYAPGLNEALRAGELTNPLSPTESRLARGQRLFATFCQVCHGASGDGDGPVIGPSRFPTPPSLKAPHARGLRDGHLYHVITHGQGLMRSYAAQVLPLDRWRLVRHLRALQHPRKTP